MRAALTAKGSQVRLEAACSTPISEASFAVFAAEPGELAASEVEERQRQFVEPLTFDSARQYAREVWEIERPKTAAIQVSRQEDYSEEFRRANFSSDTAAEARWAIPYGEALGLPRTGELSGTHGPVPYIDLTEEALQQSTILHELAHLLVDTETSHEGHNEFWASTFGGLIERHVHRLTSLYWQICWEIEKLTVEKRIARDPGWGLTVLRKSS